MSINIQGVDSINDFTIFLNGDRSKRYVASGDGVNQPTIPWTGGDFLEINVTYGFDDVFLWKLQFDGDLNKLYIVRDQRRTQGDKFTYYFWGKPINIAYA